jgi:hypothetical protein
MPASAFNSLITNYGMRLLYMRAHSCPCSQSTGTAGAANPACQQCDGRSVYFDQPGLLFAGFITWQHGPGSPDEPGVHMSATLGQIQQGEPTLTIPSTGPNYENVVYQAASEFDAYVELDAAYRSSATLIAGVKEVLPYDQGIQVLSVTVFNSQTLNAEVLDRSAYQVRAGRVFLNEPFVKGTPYTVEFNALPVYVAFRKAGGLTHTRPFGLGNSSLPKRFHLANLDVWTRTTAADTAGPQAPFYAGPKTLMGTTGTPTSTALPIVGWA